MAKQILNVGIYLMLIAQLDRLYRHNRQGSYQTRRRYYEAVKRFCAFLADTFRLQKLANVSAKHMTAYVEYMQATGKSASTVKTDLAAIRFFHDKLEYAKYRLPSNDELGVELERRRFGGVDRTWTMPEFNKLLGFALADGRSDYILALYTGRYLGLRLHETFRIDTAMAERMLREQAITVKGKGGKPRTVPIDPEHRKQLEIALRERLAVTPRGQKLLVAEGQPTHLAMRAMEQYITKYQAQVQAEGRTVPLIYHGLRHSYAADKYREFIDSGMSPLDAHLKVSQLLGHERADVTNIYLASLKLKKLPPKLDFNGKLEEEVYDWEAELRQWGFDPNDLSSIF